MAGRREKKKERKEGGWVGGEERREERREGTWNGRKGERTVG